VGIKERDENLPGMGGVFKSQNLGLFTYTWNNPLALIDPTGKETQDQPSFSKQDKTQMDFIKLSIIKANGAKGSKLIGIVGKIGDAAFKAWDGEGFDGKDFDKVEFGYELGKSLLPYKLGLVWDDAIDKIGEYSKSPEHIERVRQVQEKIVNTVEGWIRNLRIIHTLRHLMPTGRRRELVRINSPIGWATLPTKAPRIPACGLSPICPEKR